MSPPADLATTIVTVTCEPIDEPRFCARVLTAITAPVCSQPTLLTRMLGAAERAAGKPTAAHRAAARVLGRAPVQRAEQRQAARRDQAPGAQRELRPTSAPDDAH